MIVIKKTIYIRNVDAAVLSKIDELAEEKGISRNKYVNIILETFVYSDRVKEAEDKYSELVNTTVTAINNMSLAVSQMQNVLQDAIRKEN